MENIDLSVLGSTFVMVSGILLSLVQLIKTHTKLQGKAVLCLSLCLGALVGVAGLEGIGAEVFPALPGWASGGILGLLAGATASGAKDVASGVSKNAVKAQLLDDGSAKALPEDH